MAAVLLSISVHISSPTHAHRATPDDDPSEVVWGRFEVRLGMIEADSERRKAAAHLRRALPLLDELYGTPPRPLKVEVMADKSLKSGFRFSVDSCSTQDTRVSMWVGRSQDLWVYTRVLAEAYRACDHGLGQSFDGGLAEAVSQMVLQRIGVRAPWRMERIHYQQVNRPGIGSGKDYRTDTFATLLSGRFQLLATALRLFEEEHPSFFRRFHGVLAQKLSEGRALREVDQMRAAAEAEPSFAEWSMRQHLFDERPRGDQLLLVAQGDWVRLVAVRRDEFGTETPWANVPITFTIDPLGKEVRRTTDEQGEATMALSRETYVKPGKQVTLRAQAAGRSDELTFTPVPPKTTDGGPPNVWDVAVWAAGGGSLVFACWSDRRNQRRAPTGDPTTRPRSATPAWRLGALVGLAALASSIGVGGLSRAVARLETARWLRSAEPQHAGSLHASPPGERVVVMGRIDPVIQPVDRARGFALYLGEYFSTESTWEWDYTIAPPFTVLLEDGPAKVLNGCRDARSGWSIATPAYNDDCYRLVHLPVTEYNGDGNDRYRGFKPGDPVLVFGTAQAGGVVASAVSGGDLEEYAHTATSDAWTRVAIGVLWISIAIGLWLMIAIHMRARLRSEVLALLGPPAGERPLVIGHGTARSWRRRC